VTGLTTDEVRRFGEEGYLAGLPLLAETEVTDLRTRIDTVFEACDSTLHNHILQVHTVLPWAHALATQVTLLDRVESLIGPDILLWKSKCFVKFPGTSTVPWHQDMPHWDLDPPVSVTAWVALTPSHTGNGCVHVVPGSHRAGQVVHSVDKAGKSLLTSGLHIDAPADDSLRPIELEPGQMSMHDGFIVHGSDANKGDAPRIGIAFVFVPATARQSGNAHGGVMLMRGRDRTGFFTLAEPPVVDDAVLDRARTAFENYRDGRKVY